MTVGKVKDFSFSHKGGMSRGPVKKFEDGGMAGEPTDMGSPRQQPQAPQMTPQQRRQLEMQQASKRRMMIAQQAQGAMSDADMRQMGNMQQGYPGQQYKKGGKVKSRYAEGGPKKPAPLTAEEREDLARKDQARGVKLLLDPKTKAKGGAVHDDAAQDKKMIKSMIKPSALKKAAGGQAVQMAKSNAVEASLKGQKKTGYAEGGKAKKVELPIEEEAPYPSQWPMPSDEQINKENWNQRKAIRRAMGAKNTGKDTFAKGGKAKGKSSPVSKAPDMGALASLGASKTPMPAPARSVPVASQAPVIPQRVSTDIGVGKSRAGKPDVGAIRAAMAKRATMVAPEAAPAIMKKGGKVGC